MSTTSPKSADPKKHLNAFNESGERVHASAQTKRPKAINPGATAPPAMASQVTALMVSRRVDGRLPSYCWAQLLSLRVDGASGSALQAALLFSSNSAGMQPF